MATDVEKLVVSLEASIVKYERTMSKALGHTNKTMRSIERRQVTMTQRLNAGWVGMQRGIATAFAAVAATRGAVQLVDAATRIENSLKVAGVAGDELAMVYDRLFASAQKNAAPLESLATLYGRVALVQSELGTSTEEMLRFTDNVAMALRVAGTDAQSASGALLQLSQAMGSGVVRAEEFNSILEGATPIAQAAAAGLEEAGGSVAKLRQLVVDGKVSSEAFFRAFEAGAYTLEEKVGNAELTVSQQFVRLQNVLIDVAREMNEGTGASKVLGDGIANLADIVQQMGDGIQAAIGPLQTLVGLFEGGTNAARDFANEIARITGGEGIGAAAATWINDRQIPGFSAGSSAGGRVLSQTFELLGATPQDDALARALAGETPPEPIKTTVESDKPAPVSLADYASPTAAGKGGGKSGGEKYADNLSDFQRRIDLMNQETSLLRQLGPMVDDYGFAMEKLRATQELETAARRAGIELGPQQKQQIEELSTAYAMATSEAVRLAEAQEATVARFEEIRDSARSALETIIDGFVEGKDAGQIFSDVLKDIGSNLLRMGMNSLFGGGATTGYGLFGQMFGGFRAGGGPVQAGKAYVVGERRPEVFVPSTSGTIIPSVPSGGPNITFAPQIDARGADTAAVARLEQTMAQQQAEFAGRVKQIVRGKGTKWR